MMLSRCLKVVHLGLLVVCSACAQALDPADLIGTWGGEHVEVVFDADGGAAIQYDCAHGTIEPPLTVMPGGQFSATGEHVREQGGPVREGDIPDRHPARYAGEVRGDRLSFTVTLTETGEGLGAFSAQRGNAARLFRCL